ncbi:MAG: insulinase family protein [Deltaproteobacteria bacterium]|nr:insulinase family protein [Deltaproteobacteria bacterium]
MALAQSPDPAARQPEIEMAPFRLDNGLTLFVLPDHRLPIVSVQVHYHVGSRNELPGITGISHLFEHLMFRGTDELGPEEFARILQAKGGEVNAFTTRDHTSYFENLPAAHLELALRLEAHRLQRLKLDDDNFQTERAVVVSERKLRSVDSPFGLVEEELFATAYTQHPYGWPVIGWDQDLHRLTLEDCLDYYRKYYQPQAMTVVVVGDAAPEKARDLVARHFGDLPSGPALPPLTVKEPPQRGERRAIFKKVSQVEAFYAGYHVVGLNHPDIYPLTLLWVLLSVGKSARFYQEFVRSGRAAEVEVELAPPPWSGQDPDLLAVRGVAAPGASLAALEADVLAHLERLQTDGVEASELARAKKMLKAQLVHSLGRLFYRGLLVALFHMKTGEARRANELLAAYEAVTVDDLVRVAGQYLREDNRTVVILKPVSPEESQALGPLA